MICNSSVNFKLIHFLLWIKGPHQSPNFETFECSGKHLQNSSCHFPNHKASFVLLFSVIKHNSFFQNSIISKIILDSIRSKICLPQQQKWLEKTMICFIKIQSDNMKMTWNIRLFILYMICNFFKRDGFIVL